MRRLSHVRTTWLDGVVWSDLGIDLFLPVSVHIPEDQIERPVWVSLPPFVGRRDVLTAGEGLLPTHVRRDPEQEQCDRKECDATSGETERRARGDLSTHRLSAY